MTNHTNGQGSYDSEEGFIMMAVLEREKTSSDSHSDSKPLLLDSTQ